MMPRSVVFMANTTRHISARLPSDLVKKIDHRAEKQLRTRSKQLTHDLTQVYADSAPSLKRPTRDEREQ
jgi:predicted transcriptional regulator